ncbi:MAG: AAA family ATPase [Chlorobiaceae bacterium]
MRILTIALQKGGTGKSTTAHALGQGLQQQGKKVLFVDLDPQGNLSYTMRADPDQPTSFEVMTRQATAKEAIQQTAQGHLIPASPQLSGADLEVTQTGKEYRMKEALHSVRGLYDFVIIDTPPALGTLTVNALTAATGVIIPVQAETYSIQGIAQLYSTIEAVKLYCNPALNVEGILLTRYNGRAILSRDMADTIAETAKDLGTKLFKSMIREGIAVKEAQARPLCTVTHRKATLHRITDGLLMNTCRTKQRT